MVLFNRVSPVVLHPVATDAIPPTLSADELMTEFLIVISLKLVEVIVPTKIAALALVVLTLTSSKMRFLMKAFVVEPKKPVFSLTLGLKLLMV